MCEFCTKHGEGKKWYLLMKNYGEELLRAELTGPQKELSNVATRLDWNVRFFENFMLPAVTGVPAAVDYIDGGKPGVRAAKMAGLDVEERERIQTSNSQVIHYGQVVALEDVERVFDMVDSITRLPCGCRFIATGKTDKRYCFGLGMDKWGILGRFPDSASSLEVLSREEAKKLVRDYDAEGLIHTVWTGITPYVMAVCNCDHDCLPYRGYIERSGFPYFFRGEEVAQVELDSCVGCKSCIAQCQFGAINYSSVAGKIQVNSLRCYGCGVCRAACANAALSLIPRQQVPEVANLWLK